MWPEYQRDDESELMSKEWANEVECRKRFEIAKRKGSGALSNLTRGMDFSGGTGKNFGTRVRSPGGGFARNQNHTRPERAGVGGNAALSEPATAGRLGF